MLRSIKLSLVFLVLGLAVFTSAEPETFNEVFKTISEDEKSSFLKYVLIKAIDQKIRETTLSPAMKPLIYVKTPLADLSEEQMEKFEQIEIPEDAPLDLYNWYRGRNLSHLAIVRMVTSGQYCFPGPEPQTCINIDDDNNNCCPF